MQKTQPGVCVTAWTSIFVRTVWSMWELRPVFRLRVWMLRPDKYRVNHLVASQEEGVACRSSQTVAEPTDTRSMFHRTAFTYITPWDDAGLLLHGESDSAVSFFQETLQSFSQFTSCESEDRLIWRRWQLVFGWPFTLTDWCHHSQTDGQVDNCSHAFHLQKYV